MKNLNKKGFTMIELLAALGIMLIIGAISIPIIISMRKDILEKDYQSKLNSILNAGREWGYDNIDLLERCGEEGNDCVPNDYGIGSIYIHELIGLNYLAVDSKEETIFTDPRDNRDMWWDIVYVRYEYDGHTWEVKAKHEINVIEE